ncbi:MAG: lactoylglutathione lyase [Firmicutes bacterium HGW-Firmicutes-7]|nr:MAG: lactoylglutathione lyase [Firmicutes bacterium HGW-Firmicutes-7]
MKFTFAHNNISVLDLEKSIAFYKENLGLIETRRKKAEDGSYIIVFLSDGETVHKLELTWYSQWQEPYKLGDNEIHLAFIVDDYEAAYALHKKNGCICYENEKMGIYFISDPDGFWVEIIPADRSARK